MNIDQFIAQFGNSAEIRSAEPMRLHTTFRIGGPADVFCIPSSCDALCSLATYCKTECIPYFILGGGANLLVGDRGIRGVVISTEALTNHTVIQVEPHNNNKALIRAEAGLSAARLAELLSTEGWSGLEFTASLPGTVGGAVFMNARCYGHEIADVLVRVSYFDTETSAQRTTERSRHTWEYKKTPFMPGGALSSSIILEAEFLVIKRNPEDICREMNSYTQDRITKGHFDYPSAGSMFKNNRAFGRPTGMILDELGFRGKRIGDAMISPKHANIFVNAGNATASDMRALISLAQDEVRKEFGFELEPEVVFAGEF